MFIHILYDVVENSKEYRGKKKKLLELMYRYSKVKALIPNQYTKISCFPLHPQQTHGTPLTTPRDCHPFLFEAL